MTSIALAVGLDSSALVNIGATARLAEECGYSSIWCSNSRTTWDPFVLAAYLASMTIGIRLGIFVADPYSVHPFLTARSTATLQQIAKGRALLGLGAGGTGFTSLGLERDHPVESVVSAVTQIRALLNGDPILRGDCPTFRLDSIVAKSVPIIVAGRGRRMLAAAGIHADGIMISHHVDQDSLAEALQYVRRGRRLSQLEPARIYLRVDVCICDSLDTAIDLLRPSVALSLGNSWTDADFMRRMRIYNVDRSTLRELYRHSLEIGSHPNLGEVVDDSEVRRLCWLGNSAQIGRQMEAVGEMGVDEIVAVFHVAPGRTLLEDIAAFASIRNVHLS
jgi:5,10-methylenetetrahydromethanopterin reductase